MTTLRELATGSLLGLLVVVVFGAFFLWLGGLL